MEWVGQVIGLLVAAGIIYWLYGKYQENQAEKTGKASRKTAKKKHTSK